MLFNSSRFSEDLDFSTEHNREQIRAFVKTVETGLKKELTGVKFFSLYEDLMSIRFRLKYKSGEFKYPFTIRLDFNMKEKPKKVLVSSIVTRFPVIFPVVSHLSAEEILAERVRALLIRAKGRDVFDLWFLLKRGIKIDNYLVEKKLAEVKKELNWQKLIDKIKKVPVRQLKSDLEKFLPRQQRKIVTDLREKLVDILEAKRRM